MKRFFIVPKVLNINDIDELSSNQVYCGRGTPFGNPFVIGRDGNRKQVIQQHKDFLLARPYAILRIKVELRGKDLVCHCSPKPCHCDLLLEIANE